MKFFIRYFLKVHEPGHKKIILNQGLWNNFDARSTVNI